LQLEKFLSSKRVACNEAIMSNFIGMLSLLLV